MLEGLKSTLSIRPEQWAAFETFYHRLEVPAKTALIHEGQISKKAFFIEKGCVRTWFNNKGKESTFQFFFENEGISSIESFRKKIPSLYSIETVEPCVIHWIHKKDMEAIFHEIDENPSTRSQMMAIMAERQFSYMRQLMSFIRDTPRERYLNLIRERPDIIRRIPQHYIASYLGITPVSLSRIRNSLKNKSIH
jgi:CRP-like cAMP-binding protein